MKAPEPFSPPLSFWFRLRIRAPTYTLKDFRFEPLYQPCLGVWLFAWSRRLLRRHYGSTPSGSGIHIAKSARNRNIWMQAGSILVERTINQTTEVLLFWQIQLKLDTFWQLCKCPILSFFEPVSQAKPVPKQKNPKISRNL